MSGAPSEAAASRAGRRSGSGHRQVEHTADIGIRAWGESPAELFIEAAWGMIEVLVGRVEVAADAEVAIALTAASREELLVAWLNEILFWFETREFLPGRITIEALDAGSLRARLRGERYDPRCHPLERQVKAATYHRLQIEQQPHRWQATVYLDL